jgi:hypothetical protein
MFRGYPVYDANSHVILSPAMFLAGMKELPSSENAMLLRSSAVKPTFSHLPKYRHQIISKRGADRRLLPQ